MPFQIADSYDEANKSYGGLSYAGGSVIRAYGATVETGWTPPSIPGGKKSVDLYLEVVPGTVLIASVSRTVRLQRQELKDHDIEDSDGTYEFDWQLVIKPDGRSYYSIVYDHMVDMLVEDGQRVEQGQQLGKAVPARIRHEGGWWGKQPIDEFEWGIRRHVGPNWEQSGGGPPWTICPESTLIPEHREFLKRVLKKMKEVCFPSGESTRLLAGFRER